MNSGHNIFWFLGGAMTSAAAIWIATPLLRRLHERGSRLWAGAAIIGAVSLTAVLATTLYRWWGAPAALELDPTMSAITNAATHPGLAAKATGTMQVGSVEAATLKLAERLETKGGSNADWLLLAQSYDFMGRADDAKRARARAASSPAVPAAAVPGTTVSAGDASRIASSGAGAPLVSAAGTQLLAEAEKHRIAHDYPRAIVAYRRLVQMNAMTADAWANYADAAASGDGGKLDGPPADFLARALQIDPDHPKALWLQASLFHEQHRYADAIGVWQHLAGLLPPGSSDAKIIAANIDEARRLSGIAAATPAAAQASMPGAAQASTPGAAATVQISGEVDIDPTLRSKALPTSTLFVFAKASDSPGPPLAVVRASVDRWPMKFSLNDSQAMLPQRKLSDFHTVIVEARISFSGQPLAQRGDLQGSSGAVDPRSGKPVHLVIRDVIG
jgi:cytochrome c-type biogenesis protein CcmH/NrfG